MAKYQFFIKIINELSELSKELYNFISESLVRRVVRLSGIKIRVDGFKLVSNTDFQYIIHIKNEKLFQFYINR